MDISPGSVSGAARDYFVRALVKGRLSHAYLLLGPEGAGKRELALEVARMLFCDRCAGQGQERSPCGACPKCRSIEHGNHPGVSLHGPSPGKSVIDIDTVRRLCERSHYAREHAFVAILEGAGALTVPAANALLKTLEEPPGEFVLILTAPSCGVLVPTIVSRCHRLYLPAGARRFPAEVVPEVLAEVGQPGFFSRNDPRQWLARAVPGVSQPRDRVRRLLEACVATCHQELAAGQSGGLDALLEELEVLLGLRSSLDGNASPDLVLEKLLEGRIARS
jgi:hypothetical protein